MNSKEVSDLFTLADSSRLADDGSISISVSDIRAKIIEAHLPLARSIANKFGGKGTESDPIFQLACITGVDCEDVYQIACIALIKAVARFDVRENVSFLCFATSVIESEVRGFVVSSALYGEEEAIDIDDDEEEYTIKDYIKVGEGW